LVCGGRDQRGAGVGSGPVASLPHMEPSRCPAGVGSGDTSVALELAPATHVGGQRPAPTGRMPGESPATAMHRLELAPHVWRLRAETPGTANTRRYNRREKDSSPINQMVPDRRPSRLSPAGGIQSSCRGCGPWAWAFRECHDHECRGGSCSRELGNICFG
jgi:hypothetical protein